MNVFDVALAMEKEAQEQFERMAANATNRELATLYSLLAESEGEHCRHLMELKAGIDMDHASSSVLDQISNRMSGLMGGMMRSRMPGDDDGFRTVMKAEETAIRLFEKVAAKESDRMAASYLRLMAAEERAHQEVMENIYEFVEAPRTYLEWGEFSNLGRL